MRGVKTGEGPPSPTEGEGLGVLGLGVLGLDIGIGVGAACEGSNVLMEGREIWDWRGRSDVM
jgi:hypothetical protein